MVGYLLVERAPDVEDYLRLRIESGLSAKTREAAELGLRGSWYGVTIVHEGLVVGMGRIIGDGGCFFQVCDIAVHPDHQGRGLGKRILRALTEHLEREAPESSYVSLLADGEAHRLYRQFGFRPSAPASIGMFRRF